MALVCIWLSGVFTIMVGTLIDYVIAADIEQICSLIDEFMSIGYYLCECGERDWQLLPLNELTGVRDFI